LLSRNYIRCQAPPSILARISRNPIFLIPFLRKPKRY
jgi:hypothetical protein